MIKGALSLRCSSHDRNTHSERDCIANAIDVHTASLHPDIYKELFAELPEDSELCKDEVWKLHKALYGYRKAAKLSPTFCDSFWKV